MTNTEQTTSQPTLIAVSRLAKSPLNARRTSNNSGIEELKASILAHGLMQNLVVTDAGDGSFLVIAGGRRLEADATHFRRIPCSRRIMRFPARSLPMLRPLR
ncbi:MAG UNVERIFIED_CONTAM: ParB N-terminal domain-containing protein [Planctomycetaceae bacterium]|jgi:hypothetical protein